MLPVHSLTSGVYLGRHLGVPPAFGPILFEWKQIPETAYSMEGRPLKLLLQTNREQVFTLFQAAESDLWPCVFEVGILDSCIQRIEAVRANRF